MKINSPAQIALGRHILAKFGSWAKVRENSAYDNWNPKDQN